MIKRFKRNKKGFSLVELIIVIAIMVALVVVMAPAYVKYVAKSHDAVVQAAAESCLQFVKAEMANGTFTGVGKMEIKGVENTTTRKKYINVEWKDNDAGVNTMEYNPTGTLADDKGYEEFVCGCGVDEGKQIKSDLIYEIEIKNTQTVSGHPQPVASMEVIGGEGD